MSNTNGAGIAQTLRGLSSAEDFFAVLDVPYDPAVLRVARLHILRRMGEYLDREDIDSLSAERAQATLKQAYADFEAASPLSQRVFRVLKDHDPARPASAGSAFISLDQITAVAPRRDDFLSRS